MSPRTAAGTRTAHMDIFIFFASTHYFTASVIQPHDLFLRRKLSLGGSAITKGGERSTSTRLRLQPRYCQPISVTILSTPSTSLKTQCYVTQGSMT